LKGLFPTMRTGLMLCTPGGTRLPKLFCLGMMMAALWAPTRLAAQGGPAIVSGPDDISVQSGETATLNVTATGAPPLTYRWFFNSTNLLNATGATLTISNVSLLNAGLYHVIASNSSGTATSRVAVLGVDDHLTFRVLALRTNGFITVEQSGVSGDDRGAIAVSSNFVFYTGDNTTARWNIDTLGGGAGIGRMADGLVTDLLTETLYSLGNGDTELPFGGIITSLLELTPAGALTGRRINLSEPIPATGDFGQVGVFSGRGRVVIHNRVNAYSIAIPSGIVTDLGPGQILFPSGSESWAFWGVAEYYNGAIHLLYVDGRNGPRQNIIRLNLQSGTVTTVARFANLSDMAVFTISPSRSRWFFHYEGTGQFRAGDETLGSAKAIFTTDPGFPVLLRDPQSQTNYPGGTVTFSVEPRGTPPFRYQWYFNGNPIADATNPELVIENIRVQNAGEYSVEVSNDAGTVRSGPATLTIFTSPIIRAGPFNRSAYPGQSLTFFIFVDGAPPLSYEWRYNNAPIAGATNTVLTLTNIEPSEAGLYSVRVTNIYGGAISTNARLTVITAPFIIEQPLAQAEFVGSNVTFVVAADGAPPLSYQWRFGNSPIANATNSTLLLTNVQTSDAGDYSVVITNRYGSVTSTNATLTVFSDRDNQGTFQIMSLLTTAAKVVDHDELTGDDRGGIAVTRDHVFVNGDNAAARFLASDITGGVRLPGGPIDNMVTDLRTETVYRLADGTNLITFGTVTSLIEMDANGAPTGRHINLSRPIDLTGFGNIGIFSGYGRIVIHNGERVFQVLLPTGLVMDLGLMSPFSHMPTEAWAFWGVAEHVHNTIYLVYVEDSERIVRRRVPGGEVSVVASFTSLSDMASIVVSPSRRRWYFHYEGTSQFGGSFETLGYANATFNIRSGSGLDHFEWGPIGPVQTINVPFPIRLTALNESNQVVTNFTGSVALSGLNVAGETPVSISPATLANFVQGVWTGRVTVAQSSPAMFLRADDQVSVISDSPVFSVNVTNDLVVAASDSPDPVIVGETLTYSILVTNIGPNSATGVTLTNTLATNLVFVSVTTTHGSCANNGRIVQCDLGTIAGGTGAMVTVEVVPATAGLTVSQASVQRAEPDANAANNAIAISTLVTQPAITISDVSITEGDAGTNDVTFVLTLTPASTNTVRVNFGTANGTAVGSGTAADFVPRIGTITFGPGTTNQVITVGVRGDRLFENDETVLVNLSTPVNATIEDNQGVATIVNDDTMPTVGIGDVTVTELNSMATNAVFRVGVSGSSGLPVVVTYAVGSGTADAGVDFSNRLGQVTFSAGTAILTQNVVVPVYGDLTPEVNETFFFHLTSVSNATIARTPGAGTIVNDDGIGQMHHFEWSPIASPQPPNVPFPVTLSARDIGGLLITNFSGMADLATLIRAPQPSNSILGAVVHEQTFNGDYTLGYSFTPSIELHVTHVRHYFGSKVSLWTESGALLASVPITAVPGNWSLTPLTNQLVLQAGQRYRLAAYTGGEALPLYWTTAGGNTFAHGTIHESYDGAGDTFPVTADGVRWWFVDLLYTAIGRNRTQFIAPLEVGPFTNGIWSGSVSVTQRETELQLEASDNGSFIGVSNPFDVSDSARITSLTIADGEVRLRFRGVMGSTYRLERSDSLGNPSWQTVSQLRIESPGELEIRDATPSSSSRFYRAVLVP
jgi:uncharacterized repeat protein (TIGR01451 family)